ncbi:dihydroorotase, partial [Singulisphaera rosea]
MQRAKISIRRPDNFHVHFRQGDILRAVVPDTASVYARAMVMPNTDPPILTGEDATRYREDILAALPNSVREQGGFEPLMTIKLTHETTPRIIEEARKAGVIAAKLYPSGTTTGSHGGISDFQAAGLIEVLGVMRDCGMMLSIHGERPECSVLEAEGEFIVEIARYVEEVPNLRIVVEHVSSAAMANWVAAAPATVAAT